MAAGVPGLESKAHGRIAPAVRKIPPKSSSYAENRANSVSFAQQTALRGTSTASPRAKPDRLLEPGDWQRALPRVVAYLSAMGVTAPWEVERLCERVRLRAETRAAAAPLEDPVEAAIEETSALLDRWLATELGLVGDADTLFAARATVLGGVVPGWSARWAGISGDSIAAAVRAAMVVPLPESAPLPMRAATIDLFGHRLGRRIARWLRPILHPVGGDPNSTGGGS